MSAKHLTTGSTCPPKVDGKLRLYSMEYCPYAQRARLILNVKNVPHDIVNINLINKPEWYFKINPAGTVPALDVGDEVVVESLVIADYLDEKYPENPLYPSDAAAKQKDKELIQAINSLTTAFAKGILEEKTPEEAASDLKKPLQVFEDELSKRKTVFFGGEKPGMLDFMLWPWAERSGLFAIKFGQRLPFSPDQFQTLRNWKKAMKANSICAEIYNGPEKNWKAFLIKMKQIPPEYDSI